MGLLETDLMRYDGKPKCSAEARINSTMQNAGIPPDNECVIRFNITKKTTGPVYVYYGLVNFYQNSRRYARSRSVSQLRGSNPASTEECKPLNETRGPANDPITPCGLTAVSFFNDTFELCNDKPCTSASLVNATTKNIAWQVDRETLFRASDNNTDAENERITDEHFMVWMRLSPYRTWFKLYKKILEPLEPSIYYMKIESKYPVKEFGGQKFFYLAETTWFGGPNRFLGLSSIIIGGLSLLLSIVYGIGSRFAPEVELPPETQVPWTDSSTDMGGKESPLGTNNNRST